LQIICKVFGAEEGTRHQISFDLFIIESLVRSKALMQLGLFCLSCQPMPAASSRRQYPKQAKIVKSSKKLFSG
jgi:hypothetical protein